ncbi:hypothetical protein MANES_10G042300v8 [Manihot esculenta]|uniref:Uncharacterized protein n=1 Tax=Manihot esculenta TaxID=3983 RepID=A0A2C9V365_MANES|nr:hypothetical protein MANES_10G042300v8 [Manihot esculenta]
MANNGWFLNNGGIYKNQQWPWRISISSLWTRLDFQLNIIDNLMFNVLYVVESVVLVSTVCFFYLCYGCSF